MRRAARSGSRSPRRWRGDRLYSSMTSP
jgi:hypothetical protein